MNMIRKTAIACTVALSITYAHATLIPAESLSDWTTINTTATVTSKWPAPTAVWTAKPGIHIDDPNWSTVGSIKLTGVDGPVCFKTAAENTDSTRRYILADSGETQLPTVISTQPDGARYPVTTEFDTDACTRTLATELTLLKATSEGIPPGVYTGQLTLAIFHS